MGWRGRAHLLVLGLAVLAIPAAPAAATSFDSDLEGWTATGIDVEVGGNPITGFTVNLALTDNTGDMVWSDTDGNPPGFAKLTDAIPSPSSWAEAPASFYNDGNLTDFLGGTLEFDHKLIDIGENVDESQPPFGPYLAVFISGNPNDFNAAVWAAPGPSTTTDWVPFSIGLAATDLILIADALASDFDPELPDVTPRSLGFAGDMSIEEILGSLDHVLLPFELVNNRGTQNSEMGGIDNVRLSRASAPEPAGIGLLLIATAGLLLRRR